jgi:4-hydroxy-2-oxoheptanedioate aldolase
MQIPINQFLAAIRQGQTQIGCWVGFPDPNVAEALACCGFDWLLLDAEHAPNNVQTVLGQLRSLAPYSVNPIVRPVDGNVSLIKQYLDTGVQTLLVPMVDTPEQALQLVKTMRYPPEGIRGVGAALARASRWNQVENYLNSANDQMCLLVQAETPIALKNIKKIANVDGVDGVFFGPADLSATMGFRGQPGHSEVKKAIAESIKIVRNAGKAAGILAVDITLAKEYLALGANFVAVGVDTTMLVKAATDLAKQFKPQKVVPGHSNTTSGVVQNGGGY